jgi:formylglycine-generating enzyme required for sulfatase activity
VEIDDLSVSEAARRAFPVRWAPGRELDGARLSAEDRRYLERRSLTWLVLEERVSEAVQRAALMLRRDPDDGTALDLLDQVERDLARAAVAGDLEVFGRLEARFGAAGNADPQVARRLNALQASVVSSLRTCSRRFDSSGDREVARGCLEQAVRLAPTRADLRRELQALAPRPGATRTWPRDGRDMVWVPAGRFRRGASDGDRQASPHEFPVREIEVRGFWMDRHEVTNADYRRCVAAGGCSLPSRTGAYDDPGSANRPVLWVSWLQARQYAEWAGKRLPSEVEWEWAARGGASSRYPWGDDWDPSRANGLGIEGRDLYSDDAPVASFPANRWGVFDLIGNAAEYVHDVYHESYDRAPGDGRPWQQETGPAGERMRVIRGGSFVDLPVRLRVSHRDSRPSESAFRAIGFRCVAD